MAKTESTRNNTKQLDPYKWRPGQSGNPAGRPKGTRNTLGEAFLRDVMAVWEETGPEILRQAAASEPMQFSAMIARILPQKLLIDMFGGSDSGLKRFVVELVGGHVDEALARDPSMADRVIEHQPPPAEPETLSEPVRRYSRR